MDPEGMDPGERITGTRDEHYDLISAVYHALQGADACDTYALDAEATGRADLADFFRETQVVYAGVAENAKALLGNALAAGAGPVDATPAGAGVLPEEEMVLPEEEAVTPEAPAAPGSGATVAPDEMATPGAATPDTLAAPEEAATSGAGAPGAPATPDLTGAPDATITPEAPTAPGAATPEGAVGITTADIDNAVSLVRDGLVGLDIEQALAEIEGWRARLEGSGEPELISVAENLQRLSSLLSSPTAMDATAVGELLKTLGGQVQHVADVELGQVGDLGAVSDRLKALGGSLASEGDNISGR